MRRAIGAYELVRLLGRGGMSEVYEVENQRLGTRYALKLFTYEKDDEEVRSRFLTEGKLLARLSYPRIVKVVDYGNDETSGRPYFVMDLVVDGTGQVRSLADVQPGEASEEEIGRWYDDLRDGLGYIHANGVIHRDLKLQNVLIGPDGHAVLTDFGISKVFETKDSETAIVDTVKTIVKMREGRSLVMGSVGYMAPELEMGVAASPQSDWYALGVIVYKLLTGYWCDARTDVMTVLETYDPVWKRIMPKLLHANPNGRECLSYAEEKQIARDHAEMEWEERWLAAKRRGHVARHMARGLAVVVVLLSLGLGLVISRQVQERKHWQTKSQVLGSFRQTFDFDEIFKLPAEARASAQEDADGKLMVPSREDLALARIDLLVITHSVFSRLNSGKMTIEEALPMFERLRDGFAEDSDNQFDHWPNGYFQVGDSEVIHWFLGLAIERLQGLLEL